MPETVDILEQVLCEKSIIISRSLNAMLKFAFTLISIALNRGLRVLVVDERGYLERYAPLELIERITVTSDLENACIDASALVVAYMPRSLRGLTHCKAMNVVVFTRYFGVRRLGDYVKYHLNRIPGTSEYALTCYERSISARIVLELGRIRVVGSPPGIYGKAYDALKNALVTYGEMRVKDAVLVVSKELGVDKNRARMILIALARRGYLKVVKGKVTLGVG
ncbi:MAG: hypothetical protein QXH02_06085 [Desulfurococcaceae archaeon]